MKSNYCRKNHWVKVGLIWGAFMFVSMTIILPYVNDEAITGKSILIGIGMWSLGGLSFGYTMKKVHRKDDSPLP